MIKHSKYANFAIISKSSKETENIAKTLTSEWLNFNKNKNSNWLVCLYGDLGSGKTTFVKGSAMKLGIKETIISPTFLVMKKYSQPNSKNIKKRYNIYHFDCYRISEYKDILELGWDDILKKERNNIIFVEWPEKIEKILPKKRLNIRFEFSGKNSRKIILKF